MVPRGRGTDLLRVLFWGGGHALQFQHALLMVVALAVDRRASGRAFKTSPRALTALFIVAAVPLLAVPLIYLTVPPGSLPHMELFAKLMKWGILHMGPDLCRRAFALGRPKAAAHRPNPPSSRPSLFCSRWGRAQTT